jgi:ectoine hydrolase
MGNDQVVGYPDNFVQSTERHPMQHLAGLLSDMGLEGKRIGVEMENYYFSAKAYVTLRDSLPDTDLADATALVNWCRLIKSEEEIVTMRRAARIVEKTLDRVLDRVVPGMRKNDLVAEMYGDLIRGAEGAWGDYPAIVPLLPSGVNAAAPHLTWDGSPFLVGEATFFEMAGCVRRYHVPFCRTVFLGKPPDYMVRAEAALIEGLEAGLDAARAGNRACDVANALAAPLEAAGIERGARCGYPVGLSYPPDWGERTVSLRAEDQTVLEPNMTFHFMPGLWMDDWGMEITETIRITEDGAPECFCDRPRKLFVKD